MDYWVCVFYNKATINLEEKQKIAIKTMELLKDKTNIAADSSSTVIETLKLIRNKKDIVLLTNSTEVLHEFTQSELTTERYLLILIIKQIYLKHSILIKIECI